MPDPAEVRLIMTIGLLPDNRAGCRTIGLLPDVMKPRIHCVRTRWIRGFIGFQLSGAGEP